MKFDVAHIREVSLSFLSRLSHKLLVRPTVSISLILLLLIITSSVIFYVQRTLL